MVINWKYLLLHIYRIYGCGCLSIWTKQIPLESNIKVQKLYFTVWAAILPITLHELEADDPFF